MTTIRDVVNQVEMVLNDAKYPPDEERAGSAAQGLKNDLYAPTVLR